MAPSLLASGGAIEVHSYHVPALLYVILGAIGLMYCVLEYKHTRHDHTIGLSEATKWSVFYVAIGVGFAIPIFATIGSQAGSEYLAAYAMEKALSLDNLFVISLIFASFRVNPALERRMLNYGIAGAIFFRLVFILVGLELLKRVEFVSVLFGFILAHAAWKALKEARGGDDLEEEVDFTEKRLWRFLNSRKHIHVHPEFVGHKVFVKMPFNGTLKWHLTLMGAIIVLIEATDVVFAVDSVPAVLAVSPDRFIAYSSNVMAILGLRALFFVYQAIAEKFWALNWALSGILAWIAFKMIVAPFGIHVPVAISLGVLAALFTSGIVVSLVKANPSPPKHEPHLEMADDIVGHGAPTLAEQADAWLGNGNNTSRRDVDDDDPDDDKVNA